MVKNVSRIEVAAPAARVWAALTDPPLVKSWQYGSDLVTTWEVGTPIRFRTVWRDTVFEQWGTVLEFAPRPGLEEKPENFFTMSCVLTQNPGSVTLEIVQEDGREGAVQEGVQGEENPVLAELKRVAEATA